jgi:hypothetical protein
MRKRKALKGGYKYANPVMAGPFLKETLYRAKDDDIINIDKSYKDKLKAAEQDLEQSKQNLQEANKNYYIKRKEIQLRDKLDNKVNQQNLTNAANTVKYTASFSEKIIKAFWTVATYIVGLGQFAIKTISNAGRGAIIKALLFIIFIILVIVGFTKGFSGLNSQRSSASANIAGYGNSMFQIDTDNYLAIPQTDNIMTKMNDYINNLIPSEYKYNWSAISNSVSYITTGKNQYEEFLTNREETDQGRSDNIFHINFQKTSTYPKDNTFSIIEPKDVILEFNENSYYNSDYNKIDSNFNAVIKYPKKCIIKIKEDDNGKYNLNLTTNNIKYYDNNNNEITTKKDIIKPIFIKSNNVFKLNSFDNLLYSEYNNANKVLGAYAPKLINPNYKGPVIRLTYRTNNEGVKIKTINFYNNYKTSDLYCYVNSEQINFDKYFNEQNKKFITVEILYDQSGNNNHFSYSSTDLIQAPNLYSDDNGYFLHFADRHILVSNPISFKKIKIYTKIRINYDKKRLDAGDSESMFFLYRKNEEKGINIKKKDDNNMAFYYNGQAISENIKLTDGKSDETQMHYITTNDISNADKSDVVLESLGNAEDIRSQIIKDRDIQGQIRADNLDNHSLKANIYDLRIFKSDD